MRVSEQFPSKFLKAADINKRPRRYIMEAVETDNIGDDTKMILFLKGLDKGLVLNKTNSNAIVDLYGDETNDWADQPIMLYSTKVDYQGQKVDAIRVMPPLDEEDKQPVRQAASNRPIGQEIAPRRGSVDLPARARSTFNDTPADDFPGDRPPLDAYED